MNREFTVAVTTAWQNVGELLRDDLDYVNGRGLFGYMLAINEGTGVVSIKGNGSTVTAPLTDGGIKLSAASGSTPAFEWSEFDADRTWIKTTINGDVTFSGIPSELT